MTIASSAAPALLLRSTMTTLSRPGEGIPGALCVHQRRRLNVSIPETPCSSWSTHVTGIVLSSWRGAYIIGKENVGERTKLSPHAQTWQEECSSSVIPGKTGTALELDFYVGRKSRPGRTHPSSCPMCYVIYTGILCDCAAEKTILRAVRPSGQLMADSRQGAAETAGPPNAERRTDERMLESTSARHCKNRMT